jgi:hypothetical protein
LQSFAGEIERRRKRNRDKAVQEERERMQAERLEAAALRSSTGVRRTTEPLDEDNPPSVDLSDFQPLTGHADATPPDPRPGFSTLASMSTSPSTQTTIWGTLAVAASPELAPVQDSGDDGWLKDDQFLGTSELAMQMEALHTFEEQSGQATPTDVASGAGGKKGKKKKQKITLMSTGGKRGT